MSDLLEQVLENGENARLAWEINLPSLPVPHISQFHLWLKIHEGNVAVLQWAFQQAGRRHAARPMSFDHCVRWASAAMKRCPARMNPALSKAA